jgi:hypothetical protein
MSYTLTIVKKDDVLWATATGTRSLERVMGITRDIFAACAEKNVRKALLDVRGLEGHLTTTAAYDIPNEYFSRIRNRSVMTHAALVDRKESAEYYRFFEDVAVNRGYALRVFSDIGEAAEWLKR